ncbi:MAG TPA: energy-coupling factor transporter transmembrane component T [Actinomycetota bacterium]|nr:energy-coupling factor transporter transmembrane component T [Actinomycetota bacterium]
MDRQAETVAALIHPAGWIAWATCAALVTMSTTNPFYLLPVVAGSWAIHAAHRRSGPFARSFRVFLIIGLVTIMTRTLLVFLVPSSVSAATVATAFLEGLRLAVLLIVFGAFNSVADPFGVLRLAPRRFHEPALAAALALSIAPRTIAAVAQVRDAQRLRGIRIKTWRSLPALAVPVLETGMEEAVTLAESMDARGHGGGPRSRYRPDRWTHPALAIVASALVAAFMFLYQAVAAAASLTVQTSPVQWPEASPVLVGAVLLLAVPAFVRPRP